ncbi:MAG: PGF-pre-PGF domain-containing protein [archaeon]
MRHALILLGLVILCIGQAGAVHFVCGFVSNASDGTSAIDREVRAYYDDIDSYKACGVAGDNKYCCDVAAVPGHGWSIGDYARLHLPESSDSYLANEVGVTTTGEGFDIAPEMTLFTYIYVASPENQSVLYVNYTTLSVSTLPPYNDTIWYTVSGTTGVICRSCTSGSDAISDLGEGAHAIVIYANDTSNSIKNRTIVITVDAINDPPVIGGFTPASPPSILEEQNQTFTISKSDPNGDSLGVRWYINGSLLSGQSQDAYTFVSALIGQYSSGLYYITADVSDGFLSASKSWTLTVIDAGGVEPDLPPTIVSVHPATPVSVTAGRVQAFSVSASDPESGNMSYAWYLDDVLLAASASSYTMLAGEANTAVGSHTIKVVVTDGSSDAEYVWSVTVQGAPASASSSGGSVEIGAAVPGSPPEQLQVIPADTNLHVTQLKVTLSHGAESGDIKVVRRPAVWLAVWGLPVLKDVYQYFEVKHEISDDDVDEVIISFLVEKAWLDQNGHQPAAIVLKRYDPESGQWRDLPTAMLSESGGMYFYEAVSSSLSYYAIAVRTQQAGELSTAAIVIQALQDQVPMGILGPGPAEKARIIAFSLSLALLGGIIAALCYFIEAGRRKAGKKAGKAGKKKAVSRKARARKPVANKKAQKKKARG